MVDLAPTHKMHSCACCCMTNNTTSIGINKQQQQKNLRLRREVVQLEQRRALVTTSTGAWDASSTWSSYNNDLNGEPTESATCSAGTVAVAVTIARTTSTTSSSQRQTTEAAKTITKELYLCTTPASLCKNLLKQFIRQVLTANISNL